MTNEIYTAKILPYPLTLFGYIGATIAIGGSYVTMIGSGSKILTGNCHLIAFIGFAVMSIAFTLGVSCENSGLFAARASTMNDIHEYLENSKLQEQIYKQLPTEIKQDPYEKNYFKKGFSLRIITIATGLTATSTLSYAAYEIICCKMSLDKAVNLHHSNILLACIALAIFIISGGITKLIEAKTDYNLKNWKQKIAVYHYKDKIPEWVKSDMKQGNYICNFFSPRFASQAIMAAGGITLVSATCVTNTESFDPTLTLTIGLELLIAGAILSLILNAHQHQAKYIWEEPQNEKLSPYITQWQKNDRKKANLINGFLATGSASSMLGLGLLINNGPLPRFNHASTIQKIGTGTFLAGGALIVVGIFLAAVFGILRKPLQLEQEQLKPNKEITR